MKKTNKFLSIILAILMVVTTVPFAFAAESGDFEYSITDEVAVITGYNGDSGALEIPATIDGYPVSVGPSAFMNNEEITSLTFYGDIVFNAFSTFGNCTNLTTVTFAGDVEFNANYTFKDCSSLTTVTFAGDVEFNSAFTFKNCSSLTTVTFAGDADFNTNYTFSGCTNLKNITFIGNVNTYKDNGYYYPFFDSNDTHSVEVHFGGTEGEWESSTDIMGYKNCPIKNATPHYCTEKDVIAKTCTEDGYQAGWYCSDCEKYVVGGEVIPASHEIETVEAQAPTCTEIGWDAYEYCTACDYTTYVEKEALNHKDTLETVEAKAPTCTEIGWDAYEYCTACDYTTYAEKAALDHDIVIDEAVAPKCGETGLTQGQHCSRCDAMTVVQETVPALTHTDADGDYKCDHGCGYEFEKPAEPEADCACGKEHNNFFDIILCFLKGMLDIISEMLLGE